MRRWGRRIVAVSTLAMALTLIGCTLNPSREPLKNSPTGIVLG